MIFNTIHQKQSAVITTLIIVLVFDGLYTAMTTTVGGLIVGIISYIAYNHLVVKTDKVVYQMEAKSVEFLDLLNEPV